MPHWFKNIKRSFTPESSSTIIGVTCLVLLLRYLGLLQSWELAAYDFLFWLRPPETKDERIVIVTWDENQIQTTQEVTISDLTLVSLIKIIGQQEPRLIGLDLYRDLKVESPRLSDERNRVAYRELQQLFRSTPHLVGIEKVIPPITNPPLTLKQEGRTGAADLPTDSDLRIRRAFLHPLEDEAGNPAGTPSFGFYVGYHYLAAEGFEAERIENNALLLVNSKTGTQNTIEPLKKLDGSYLKPEEGISFLVNWRKASFSRVSVTQVLEGSVPTDIFRDKIVLIGNTAISTSDRHFLPTDRWQKLQPSWSYGVEIQAQIISHLISSALDGRTGIRTVPEWCEIGLLLLVLWLISLIARNYAETRSWRLFIVTTTGTVIILCALVWLSYLAFLGGYWIPIAPSFLGGLVCPFILCTAIYIRKINSTNEDFKRLLKDINHSLKNPLRSLSDKAELARYVATLLEENNTVKLENIERQLRQPPLTNLKANLDDIVALSQKINYLRDNAQKYFGVAYLGQEIFNKQATDLNQLVKKTFESVVALKQREYQIAIAIEERYDNTIGKILLDSQSIARVIENLIDNAFYAIKARTNQHPTHQGKITLQTQKNRRVEVIISDNGTGIKDSLLSQIFLPFKSFKVRGQGQGLGLALAKETMLFHQGDIEVKTTEGQGSTFTLLFGS